MSTSASGIFASSLKKHTGKLLDVMTDVFTILLYPQDEFEKIRKRTASNLATTKTSPEAIAGNIKSIVNLWSESPLW
jgi:zinc protease